MPASGKRVPAGVPGLAPHGAVLVAAQAAGIAPTEVIDGTFVGADCYAAVDSMLASSVLIIGALASDSLLNGSMHLLV